MGTITALWRWAIIALSAVLGGFLFLFLCLWCYVWYLPPLWQCLNFLGHIPCDRYHRSCCRQPWAIIDCGHANVDIFVAFFSIYLVSKWFNIELYLIEFYLDGVETTEKSGIILDAHCCRLLADYRWKGFIVGEFVVWAICWLTLMCLGPWYVETGIWPGFLEA